MATSLAGKPLVDASWALLKRDPSMVVLLVVGGLASSLAFALVALPTYLIVGLPVDGTGGPLDLAVYAVAVFASTLVSTFFLGAVVDAAMQRADGGDPTFGTAMAAAWERRSQLVAWAAMAAAVGVALRLLERFGVAGAIVRLLAGVSWAVATAFAIPVIMAEGTMPIETVKRSAHVLTSRFGSNARAGLRFGVVVVLVWLGLFALGMVGIYGIYDGSTHRNGLTLAIGGLLLVAAVLGGFIASAVVSALGAYLRTVLYRYATGLPTPGIDPWVLPPLLPETPTGPGGAGAPGGLPAGAPDGPAPTAPAPSLFAWPDAPAPGPAPSAYVVQPGPAPSAYAEQPGPAPSAYVERPTPAPPAPSVAPAPPSSAAGAGQTSPYPPGRQVFLPEGPA